MATIEQLEQALRKAHKAGDKDAARRFAAEIKSTRQSEVLNQPSVKEQFNEEPWYNKLGIAADDTMRLLANGMTLGYADKLAGAVSGDTEFERTKTDQAKERAGGAGTAAEILGLIAPAGAASKAVGATVPGLQSLTRLLPTLGRETIAGSAIGAGTAAGHDEDILSGAVSGAAGGFAGGFMGNMAGKGINWVSKKLGNLMPGILSDKRIPRKDLSGMIAEKNAAYHNLDESGIRYSGADADDMLTSLFRKLDQADIDPELHKKAAIRFRRMNKRIGGKPSISVKDVDTQRQLISRDVKGSGGENEMARILRDSLDEFVDTVEPQGSFNSTRQIAQKEAQSLTKNARELNRRTQVYDTVNKAIEKGKNRRSSYSGEVSPFRSMLDKGTRGMSDTEAELLENIVRGEGWDQALSNKMVDAAARLGSIGTGATAGGLLAGPPGALAGAGASLALPPLAKAGARSYTKANIEALLDELGGGKTIDAATKLMLNRISGGTSGGVLAKESVDERKRKRKKESRR